MNQLVRCEHCGEIFDLEDCERRKEYVDDSGRMAYCTPICPFCGSDELEEYEEPEEEEEDAED